MGVHALFESSVLSTYARLPLAPVKGKGVFLWDADGNKFFDFVAGVAVNNLGHAHPAIVKALREQASKIIHCSNLYEIPGQGQLACQLTRLTGLTKAFFCNSGAEAIEAAIKFSRAWSLKKFHPNRYEIIVMENSFHGRTMGALSATAQPKYQQGFGPLLPGFKVVPYNDLMAVKAAITQNTAAILLEPLQGEGGVRIPDAAYLPGLRKICDENQLLLMLDEVQVGMGRTGKMFAYEHAGILPDVLVLAKGLGSGFPIGATLVNPQAAEVIHPGMHASTFGGSPLAAAVALATINELTRKNFLKKVVESGAYFVDGLKKIARKYPGVKEVRGMGLMVACELSVDRGPNVVTAARERGLLINCIQNRVLRFVPPLIVTKTEIKQVLGLLEKSFEEVFAS